MSVRLRRRRCSRRTHIHRHVAPAITFDQGILIRKGQVVHSGGITNGLQFRVKIIEDLLAGRVYGPVFGFFGIVGKGEMVNVASAVSHKLADSPNAPLITDLGSKYSLDGYFMFIAPKGLAPDARTAISNAIADVLNDPATQAHALVVKSFGGPAVLTGAALNDKLNTLMTESKDLLATASAN